ncbi:MAG TPA: DUF5671 domain-containing protein [Anaerolineaceae bacterium]|nr:DUF5671 domain-containing protein [Anaerolineaceae bacterium]
MRTVRRVYLYAIAFISLEMTVWGVIWLGRTIFSAGLAGSSASLLAGSLSLTLVGLPVFLLHWLLAQGDAARNPEDRTSRVRAVFLYAALLAHFIPAVHNGLALANRLFLALFRLDDSLALIGAGQTWGGDAVAILANLAAGAYFLTVIRAPGQNTRDFAPGQNTRDFADRRALPGNANLAGARRLQRYIWLGYSLGLVVLGVQQLLSFILYVPGAAGPRFGGLMAAGLALLLVGVPLWVWSSLRVEDLLHEPEEQASLLRLVVLYLLVLLGAGAALGAAGMALAALFRQAFGAASSPGELVNQLSAPLSIGVPLGVVWAYYGSRLTRDLANLPDTPQLAALRRLYLTILSALGLLAAVIGLRSLLLYLLSLPFPTPLQGGSTAPGAGPLRDQLAAALAVVLTGLPLWIFSWRPLQQEAARPGPAPGQNTSLSWRTVQGDFAGDQARHSVIRKAYLYLLLFAGVLAMMVSTGEALYPLLRSLLGSRPPDLLSNSLGWLLTLLLFTALTAYHFTVLRGDARLAGQALAARQRQFPVIVLDPAGLPGPEEEAPDREAASGFAADFLDALHAQAPDIPVALVRLAQGIPTEGLAGARAVVLPAALATQPPEALRIWLDGFQGQKLVIPLPEPGWEWLGPAARSDRRDHGEGLSTQRDLAEMAALAVRQMAEGQPVRLPLPSSPWTSVAYVLAALFALELLLLALGLLASRF